MNDRHPNCVCVREIEPKGKGVLAAIYFTQGETVLICRKVRVLPQKTPHSI